MLLLPGGCGYFSRTSCSGLGTIFAHLPPGARNLDRNHPGADDLEPKPYFLLGLFEVVHFDGEVMDAGAFARGLRLGGFVPAVVLHEREVDRAVRKDGARYGAHFFRLGFP